MKVLIEEQLKEAIGALQQTGVLPVFDIPEIRVERPKDEQFGEYTTNVALMIAKQAETSPREIAELIKSRMSNLESGKEDHFEKIEVAGTGHLNFYLSQDALADVVRDALKKGESFGDSNIGAGEKVNNEFISANPTGPLHLGNGRGGFYADSLSRVLRKSGYDVTNEYYINDAGEQVFKLGHSVLKDDQAVYGGEYIDALNEQLTANLPTGQAGSEQKNLNTEEVGEKAADIILEKYIKKTLAEKMAITFDVFTSEKKDILEEGFVDKAIAVFREKGLVFEEEGALWLRTTQFDDDKDRVLVKRDGTRTYFASDCGYILQKMERAHPDGGQGFSRLIETWGADHHGYVARFKAAAQALGFQGKIDFILVQLVKLVKDGVEVRMSKRAGNVVTIDELIETVGHDVARFFFLMYSPDTHMNFDLGLAGERSAKNPVFYVQYAHARLASILRKAKDEKFAFDGADLSLLTHPKERELMRELLCFPELVETIAEDFCVHRLPQYAIRLADKLHSFYDECRVLDVGDKPLSDARLELIRAVKIILGETLALMGIVAPEKM